MDQDQEKEGNEESGGCCTACRRNRHGRCHLRDYTESPRSLIQDLNCVPWFGGCAYHTLPKEVDVCRLLLQNNRCSWVMLMLDKYRAQARQCSLYDWLHLTAHDGVRTTCSPCNQPTANVSCHNRFQLTWKSTPCKNDVRRLGISAVCNCQQ